MGKMLFYVLLFPKGMQEILRSSCCLSECKSEAAQFASVAVIVRRAMFQNENKFTFGRHFPTNCQKDSVPYSLKLLISMIINGPSLKVKKITLIPKIV